MAFGQGELWRVRFQKRWNLERGGLWSGGIMDRKVFRKGGHKMGSVIITVFPQGFHSWMFAVHLSFMAVSENAEHSRCTNDGHGCCSSTSSKGMLQDSLFVFCVQLAASWNLILSGICALHIKLELNFCVLRNAMCHSELLCAEKCNVSSRTSVCRKMQCVIQNLCV